MKGCSFEIITLLVLFLSFSGWSQTFSELRGIEDSTGTTHLYYRLESSIQANWSNHIYHLIPGSGTDVLFLQSYYMDDSLYTGGQIVLDYDFWNIGPAQYDPDRYLYGGYTLGLDPDAFISRYDTPFVFSGWMGSISRVQISHQNGLLAYAGMDPGYILKSTDGGFNWQFDASATEFYQLLALSPFDDQVLFAIHDSRLARSSDGGNTFTIVDSASWSNDTRLVFDPDGLHLYATTWRAPDYHLLRSSDGGLHWQTILTDTGEMVLAVDELQSGEVYLAIDTTIFRSHDYGNQFLLYRNLPEPVVGLYKKPATDTLYAATTHTIFEITPSGIMPIKNIVVGIDDSRPILPQSPELYQNYPNPFNGTTVIRYRLPIDGRVEISVYNALGQKIRTLVNTRQTAGSHEVTWDGRDDAGQSVASGVYIYRMKTPIGILSKKLVILP